MCKFLLVVTATVAIFAVAAVSAAPASALIGHESIGFWDGGGLRYS
jgi:hypothetical protein